MPGDVPGRAAVADDTTHMPKADMVFIATPTGAWRRRRFKPAAGLKMGNFYCLLGQGFEMGSLKLMSEVIEEEHPGVPVVALSAFTPRRFRGQITAIVAACAQPDG